MAVFLLTQIVIDAALNGRLGAAVSQRHDHTEEHGELIQQPERAQDQAAFKYEPLPKAACV